VVKPAEVLGTAAEKPASEVVLPSNKVSKVHDDENHERNAERPLYVM
jgi:hypothetical protein